MCRLVGQRVIARLHCTHRGVRIMWLLLKGLAVRFVIGRTVGGMLATLLVVLVPLAGVLKFIGLPILLVLGALGAPLFLLLAAIGLPILLVVGMGGIVLVVLGLTLALGLLALKIALPIILVVWLVRMLRRRRTPPPIAPNAGPAV
jgi:hypothetical protein